MEPQSRKIVIFRLLSREKLLTAPSSDLIEQNQGHQKQEEHQEHQDQPFKPTQRHQRAHQRHRGKHDHQLLGQEHHNFSPKDLDKVFLGPETEQGASRHRVQSNTHHHKGTADLKEDPDQKLAQNPKIPQSPKTSFIPKMTIF